MRYSSHVLPSREFDQSDFTVENSPSSSSEVGSLSADVFSTTLCLLLVAHNDATPKTQYPGMLWLPSPKGEMLRRLVIRMAALPFLPVIQWREWHLGQPCRRCSARQKICTYPAQQDTIIPVPASYLQHIDRSLNELTDAIRASGINSGTIYSQQSRASHDGGPQNSKSRQTHTSVDKIVNNSTTEAFLLKFREAVGSAHCPNDSSSPRTDQSTPSAQESPQLRMRLARSCTRNFFWSRL